MSSKSENPWPWRSVKTTKKRAEQRKQRRVKRGKKRMPPWLQRQLRGE